MRAPAGGSGQVKHRQRGRGPRRDTLGVPAIGLARVTTGGEIVAFDQRGRGQRALRRDRGDRGSAGRALSRTARPAGDHQGPHQLPLVASSGMMLRELFSRIRYKTAKSRWSVNLTPTATEALKRHSERQAQEMMKA